MLVPLLSLSCCMCSLQVAQTASELLPATPACSSATARHLAAAYGDQAQHVLQLAASQQLSKLLVQGHPYLEAEVVWAVR
jgi:glycerol-3-phosphate dehydrogenase